MDTSAILREFLKDYLATKKRGVQKQLAEKCGIDPHHLSDFIHGRKPLSEQRKINLARAIGFQYDEILAAGRALETEVHENVALWDKVEIEVVKRDALPIDTPTRLLHEVLAETGIRLNDDQKQIVVKVLRGYLKTVSNNAKKIAKDLVESMPNGGDADGGPEGKSKKSAD